MRTRSARPILHPIALGVDHRLPIKGGALICACQPVNFCAGIHGRTAVIWERYRKMLLVRAGGHAEHNEPLKILYADGARAVVTGEACAN
jgi:hypothetical protein